MSAGPLEDVERIFAEAVELPVDRRLAHVQQACAGAPELLIHVLRLLEADAADVTLDLPPPTLWLPDDTHAPGHVVGERYRLVRVVGAGGLGVVWQAEQLAPVRRQVAVKFIRHDLDGRQITMRFALELSALSLMDHPGIAKIHDAGCEPDGRPYFAMELVDGEPLTTHCDRDRLTIAARVAILADVCLAVHHAHQKGIVHRDLKPSNILVARVDGKSLPKVIDFGVAKAMAPERTPRRSATTITRIGQIVGSPAYMAPEQLAGDGAAIDVRCDIFALGVVLHELLAGCLPHDRSSLSPTPALVAPPAAPARSPSSSVRRFSAREAETIAELRRETPRTLRRRLRGELDWIAARAMAEEPSRRYASASELEADLRRWLRHEPVAAGPPGAAYQVRKLVQRHTTAVAATLLVALSLALGLVGTSLGLLRAREAERRQRELNQVAQDAVEAESAQRRAALGAAQLAALNSYKAQIAAVDAALASQDVGTASRILAATDARLRGWEWRYLHQRCDQSDVAIEVGGGAAWTVLFAADGEELLVASQDGSIRSFDATTGAPRDRVELGVAFPFWIDRSRHGDRVVVGSTSPVDSSNFQYRLLEWPSGRTLARGAGRVRGRAFSPEGDLCAVADAHSPRVHLLDARDGGVVRTVELPPEVRPAWTAFAADGVHLGFWSDSQGIAGTLDLRDGTMRRWSVPSLTYGAFEPSSGLYLGGDPNGDVLVLRPEEPRERLVVRCRSPRGRLESLLLSRDQSLAAGSSSLDGAVQLHDLRADRPIAVLNGHLDRVLGADFSPDGRALATASLDGTVRIWRLPPATDRFVAPLTDPSGRLGAAITRDGRSVASGGWGNVQLWRSDVGALVWTRDLGVRYVELLAFSPDETRLAVAETDGRVMLLAADDGALQLELEPIAAGHTALCWGPSDRRLLLAGADGTLRVVSTETGRAEATWSLFDGPVTALAISADGALFAAGAGAPTLSRDNWGEIVTAPPAAPQLVVGRLEDGVVLARVPLALGPSAACFDPRGRLVFAGRNDGSVLAFDVDAIIREGAPGSRAGDAAVWEARATRCMPPSAPPTDLDAAGRPRVSMHQVSSLACVPDGSRLLVGQRSGTVDVALPDDDGLLLTLDSDWTVHATAISDSGALVVACKSPFIAFEGALPSPGLSRARERGRTVRALVDPIVVEERILERVLARIDDATADEALREDATRYARARGEYRALMVSQAIERARDPTLRRGMHEAALRWLEHVRSQGLPGSSATSGSLDVVVAMLCVRIGEPRRAVDLLGGALDDAGGVDSVADPAIPAVLALAQASLGETQRATALMEALERRLSTAPPLKGEAQWYVPEAMRTLAAGR